MRTTRISSLLFVLVGMNLAAGAFGQQVVREGVEFQVNAYTAGHQGYVAVAADSSGDFVVVWEGTGATISIFGQRFTSAGLALATEFQVNTYTDGNHRDADVAMDADGDFIVIWKDENFGNLLARRYSSAGAPLSGDFKVVQGEGQGSDPAIDADADGDFVVAWVDYSADGDGGAIVAGRFSSAGTSLATELVVNTYTPSDQRHPDVSTDMNGDFVVVWDSFGHSDGSELGVFARLLSSSGALQGSEIQINAYTTGFQSLPAVSMEPNGDFVVAWDSYDQDGGDYGPFARLFSSTGAPQTGELQIATYTLDNQRFPAIAANGAGAFVVSWMSFTQDGDLWGVFARRFSSTGVALATELQVNTYTSNAQREPDVASSNGATFVVVWQSNHQDGSSYGAFGQRFSASIILDVDGNGIVEPLTDLLLGMRYSFGFRGNTLIGGAVGMGCTRCDAPSIEAYLAGLVN